MVTRREILIAGAALAGSAAARNAGSSASGFSDQDFRRAIVIDGLGGVDDPYGPPEATVFDPRAVADLKTSGLTMSHFTVNSVGNGIRVWEETITTIARTDQLITDNAEVLIKVSTTADIRRAKREGKSAILYGTQDTSLVGVDLDRLALLRGLGVRSVQLTYNLRNLSGDGSLEPGNAGLSKLGYLTIARIEKEKMLVDFSHGGQRTIAEGIAATTRPPVISHTGCRALNDNPRNVWDAELRACADKGGVIGIYWMPFLVANSRPSSVDLIRHMDHAKNVCGEDHVSIGTDGILSKTVIDDKSRANAKKVFEERSAQGIAAPGEGPDVFTIVADWDDIMRYRHLADGLWKTGWTSGQVEKALGANLMRVYGESFG
jgi:membrane dipeptidase